MNPFEMIKISIRGIVSNKLRSLLTMLGVIIGVAAVIVMMAVSAGTEAQIAAQINSLGANLLFISASMQSAMEMGPNRGSTGLVYDDVEAISQKINGISGVSVEQTSSETVKYGSTSLDSISLVGTTADFPSVREYELSYGRWFNETEVDENTAVVVLGSTVAQELFGMSNPVGEKITVGTVKLAVIGVMEEKGTVGGTDFDSRIYTPITVVFQKFTDSMFARITGDSVRMIYVQVADGADTDEVITQLTLLLAKRHGVTTDDPDFTIQTQEDIITTLGSTTASFRSLLGWVAGVSLLVGGIGIMNIMLVSVTERTREIGIRQAVGASPGDIEGQFLIEALIMSLTGGALGVIGGVAGAYIFGHTSDMPTVISTTSIALSFASAAAVGIFFGVFPARKAAKLDPIQALRHE